MIDCNTLRSYQHAFLVILRTFLLDLLCVGSPTRLTSILTSSAGSHTHLVADIFNPTPVVRFHSPSQARCARQPVQR